MLLVPILEIVHLRTRSSTLMSHLGLGFLGLDLPPATTPALHAYLDSWRGIGLIDRGLARQGRDLSLTRYGDRWGAAIFVTGKVHAIVQGTGWQVAGGFQNHPLPG